MVRGEGRERGRGSWQFLFSDIPLFTCVRSHAFFRVCSWSAPKTATNHTAVSSTPRDGADGGTAVAWCGVQEELCVASVSGSQVLIIVSPPLHHGLCYSTQPSDWLQFWPLHHKLVDCNSNDEDDHSGHGGGGLDCLLARFVRGVGVGRGKAKTACGAPTCAFVVANIPIFLPCHDRATTASESVPAIAYVASQLTRSVHAAGAQG